MGQCFIFLCISLWKPVHDHTGDMRDIPDDCFTVDGNVPKKGSVASKIQGRRRLLVIKHGRKQCRFCICFVRMEMQLNT